MFLKASACGVAVHSLLTDPRLYVFDYDPQRSTTRFLFVDEKHLEAAPFIDIRFEPMAMGSFVLPTDSVLSLEDRYGEQRAASAFIFHHAFVCSTLLARCLNQSNAFFSLKEPWILRRLADIKRNPGLGIPKPVWKRLVQSHAGLLAKDYSSGRMPIIKATNVANNLIGEIVALKPARRVLYLYSDLESFLISNIKKPEDTKRKMPELAKSFVQDEDFARRFPQYSDVSRLSFLEVCGLVWAASLYNFLTIRSENVRTLEMGTFLAQPAGAVRAVSEFFGHVPSDEELAVMTGPEVMNRNAKHPQKIYGSETRSIEARHIIAHNRPQLDRALAWAKPLVEQLGLIEEMRSRQISIDTDAGIFQGPP